jgi:CheY-like chemotaxis protein
MSRGLPTGKRVAQHHLQTVGDGEAGSRPVDKKSGAQVLIVDDDSDLVEAYRQVLEMAGYRVATALSAEVALGMARLERPDIVLTDVSMPNMDGFELINRLKGELGGRTPPVVVCSAFDMTEQEAVSRGAELFLQKPASPAALVESVEALCHGAHPDDAALASERSHALHERERRHNGSELRLRDVDHAAVAREAQPWLEWMRRYFDCGSAGLFLLEGGAVLPLVVVGPQMAGRPEPRLLHVTLAAGVETGTSLVVRDMATHPIFRRVLGTRVDIASFAGVPLVTADGVRVGALCLADAQPGRLDADSLVMMEYLGRRGVSEIFEKRLLPVAAPPRQAPLLANITFETLLAAELKIARRFEQAVEIALGALAPGILAGACAELIWSEGPHARLAIGSMGAGRIGVFMRGGAREVRKQIAERLARARDQGLLDAAGVAGVMASAGLSKSAVIEIAESALSIAEAASLGSKVERIVIRSEPGRPVA